MIGETTLAIVGICLFAGCLEVQTLIRTPRYQRAYVDFFEDQLVLGGYDWHKIVDQYLFDGQEPLVNCLIAGCTNCLLASLL